MRLLTSLREKVGSYPSVKGWLLKRMITDYPLALNIEVTNHCNLKCSFCPRDYLKKEKGLMDSGLYRKIIDNISEDERKVGIFFHNFGEPLLHPGLIDMISYAKDKGIARSIQFSTNGILMKGGLARELIEVGVDEITVSIDAADADSYRQLKGVELNIVEQNIVDFMKLKKDMGASKPHIRTKIMLRNNNRAEEKPFLKKWSVIADSATVDWYSNFGGILDDDTVVDQAKRYGCSPLWYRMIVSWDGLVLPCCVDINAAYPVGDLGKESIKDVWNGERMESIRSIHLRGAYTENILCHGCNDWHYNPNIEDWLKSKGRKHCKIK